MSHDLVFADHQHDERRSVVSMEIAELIEIIPYFNRLKKAVISHSIDHLGDFKKAIDLMQETVFDVAAERDVDPEDEDEDDGDSDGEDEE